MNAQESTLIAELFDRIAQSTGQQRDPEAEQLIQSKVAANPHAPYVLAQSTIILQQAVTTAQNRITALEKQLAEATPQSQGGGFLSGVSSLFGSPLTQTPPRLYTTPPIPINYYGDQNSGDHDEANDDQGHLVDNNDDQDDFGGAFDDGGDDNFA